MKNNDGGRHKQQRAFLSTKAASLPSKKRKCKHDDEEDDGNTNNKHMTGNALHLYPSHVKVGDRIAVYWSDDETFYPGKVLKKDCSQNNSRRGVGIKYNDGVKEWLKPEIHHYQLLAAEQSTAQQ